MPAIITTNTFLVNVDDATHVKLEAGERIRIVGSSEPWEGEIFFIVRGGKRSEGGGWQHPCIHEADLADWEEGSRHLPEQEF